MIIEAKRIDQQSIKNLASGKVHAVRIKNYLSRELSRKLAEKIVTPGYDHYINAPSIGRIGMAFYEAENKPELLETYFSQARSHVDDLRHRCLPYASPIDKFRCEIDEAWPAGAHLESLYGKKMYVGLSRVVEPGVYFLAHHDILEKDAPDSYRARSLKAQFACNVYIDMPDEGGELEVWEKEIDPAGFDEMRGSSYGISPELLGRPALRLKPEIGELILFNSKKMHAVAPSINGHRLSVSCFVGYRGDHEPLTFWS